MTAYPRLYVNNKFSKIIHPISLSLTQNIVPLSTASVTLPVGEELPLRSYVELFTPYGSAGMFRARSPHNSYGRYSSSAELEHMIAEVGDYLVKGDYDSMMPATTAVSTAFGFYKGSHWKLGNISDLGSGNVAFEAKYESVLNVIMSVLDQKPNCMLSFDFSTTPWTMNIVKRGTTVKAEGRLARNVTSAEVTYDDSELVTRVWYETFPKDKDGNSVKDENNKVVTYWNYKDANTDKYGIIEAKIGTSSDMTDAEVNSVVNTYLNAHKQPRTSVSIQATELSSITKERLDKFFIGDLMRLALPDYNTTVELNITSISWSDVYNSDSVTVQLGEEEDTVVTFLHNLDSTGKGTKGGSGGGGGRSKQDEKWKEYFTTIEQTDEQIALTAYKVDRANNILEQAGMKLNSKGVLIYAEDKTNKKTSLLGRIKVEADKITSEVVKTTKDEFNTKIEQTATSIRTEVKNTRDDLESSIEQTAGKIELKVSKGEVISSINQTAETITISASKIDLSGYVGITEYNATKGTVQTLSSGDFTGVGVRCGTLSITAAQFSLGVHVVWKSTIKDYNGDTVNVMKWG